MGADPKFPQQTAPSGPQWQVTPGGKKRRVRAYLIAGGVFLVLLIVLLVLLVLRFGGSAPATGPKHGTQSTPPKTAIQRGLIPHR